MKFKRNNSNQLILSAFLVAGFLLSVFPAFADEESVAAAEKLIKTMKLKQQFEPQMNRIEEIQETMIAQQSLSKEEEQLARKAMEASLRSVKEQMSWEQMQQTFVKIYASVFTADELEQLHELFASRTGQVFVNKQDQLNAKMMTEMAGIMAEAMPKIQEATQKAIQEAQKEE